MKKKKQENMISFIYQNLMWVWLAIMIVCTGMTVLLSGKAKKRNS